MVYDGPEKKPHLLAGDDRYGPRLRQFRERWAFRVLGAQSLDESGAPFVAQVDFPGGVLK